MKKLLLILSFLPLVTNAQQQLAVADSVKEVPHVKHWYESVSLRGYMQVRYNRLLETNPQLKCEACDKSIGDDGGIFIRRMRIILFGQIHERVYFYIQPDIASSATSTALNFAQMRDAYVDLGFDKKNEFRLRLGQSKVPYGFENMQSSQNRLTLDRADAINSGVPNERDLGAFFYWAPADIRKRFSQLVADGYKGSGDYGVFAFGVYNGQGLGKPELNNELHMVSRVAYPFKIGNKIVEPAIQGYKGHYVIPTDQLSSGVKYTKDRSYIDERVGATFVIYPKPWGIQAEYNVGRGPRFNKVTDSIEVQSLNGGYITFNYFIKLKHQSIYPFVKYQYYNGGKKNELDARSYEVSELETGIEWLPIRNFELTAQYTVSNRRFEDFKTPENLQKGNMLRIQAQLNF